MAGIRPFDATAWPRAPAIGALPALILHPYWHFVCIAWNGNDAVGDSLTLKQYLELGHVICQFNRGRTPIADEWYLQNHAHTRRTETVGGAIDLLTISTYQRRPWVPSA